MSVWTDKRVARLKELWLAGQSAGAIAMELEQSRGAVIGKIGRLGLLGQRRPRKAHVAPLKPIVRQTKPSDGLKVANAKRRVERLKQSPGLPAEKTSEPALPSAPTSLRLAIVDLTSRTCRWPSGHPGASDFSFCGSACPVERPYCEYHQRAARS